jgi:hypothetical protein
MGSATLVGSLVGREVPLSVGVLAHEGGTLLVVLNSLLLLWHAGLPAENGEIRRPFVSIPVKSQRGVEANVAD